MAITIKVCLTLFPWSNNDVVKFFRWDLPRNLGGEAHSVIQHLLCSLLRKSEVISIPWLKEHLRSVFWQALPVRGKGYQRSVTAPALDLTDLRCNGLFCLEDWSCAFHFNGKNAFKIMLSNPIIPFEPRLRQFHLMLFSAEAGAGDSGSL